MAHQETWHMEYLTSLEEAWDQAEHELWAELLALEQKPLQVMWTQNNILGWAMEAMDDDCQTLDTVLGLAVSCMPTTALPPALVM
ncbi:hypothetical protein Y1Q_0019662 [Alligator mississippiensis]|uniref:Uncharacterized protein n=1 Tax=Alligator mississippiensis TaxID=8496 RepID=A0A151PES1_ALLMI|nr:hypothetical protein Y1Q_0019662 [Alligator mississippiensis]